MDAKNRLIKTDTSDHGSAYSDAIEAEADQDVILAGRQPRDVVFSLNRDAGLFVLPSYHEGLSIAALEAINAGTPVLFSDIEENRNIGLPDRQYFRSGSVDCLARKLQQDFANFAVPGDFDLGAYDWDRIACLTLEQYDQVVDGSLLACVAPKPATITDSEN